MIDKSRKKGEEDLTEEMGTTMGTSMDNFTNIMLEMAKEVKSKADLLFRDLIEPSDLYCKHYTATNSILIEQAT